jgi:peptidoglycan/xylan/chitin deacetylase (PgdA/CDA1 family)
VRRGAAVLLAALITGCGGGGGATAPPTAPVRHQVAVGPIHRAVVHVPPSHAAVPILMYHVIGTPPASAAYPGLWVSGRDFQAQVDALARAGYRAVTLDTVLDAWRGRARLPAHPVVLSFDDGYLGQGRVAGPILAARHWPGVINIVLANLGTPGGISPTRVRELVRAGWEVDAHTLTHRDLTALGPADLRHEIAGSRAALRRRFGVPVDAFCYPAGRFDAAVEAAVRAAGYRAATTELPGAARPANDRFALPRLRVDGGESAAALVSQVRVAVGSAT